MAAAFLSASLCRITRAKRHPANFLFAPGLPLYRSPRSISFCSRLYKSFRDNQSCLMSRGGFVCSSTSGAGEKRVLCVMSTMRSRRSFDSKALLILAFVCAILTSTVAQASRPLGRVIVKRGPAVRMESGFQSSDRWQACGDPRTGSPLPRLAASGAPCPNSVHGVLPRLAPADLDNSEHRTGVDLCVHCGVGFESDLSPPIGRVGDPRRAVAT